MIIDCDTWKHVPSGGIYREGLPVFVSWKRLKEMLVGDQQAYAIEVGELGLLFRVNMNSYDERSKHLIPADHSNAHSNICPCPECEARK